MHSSSAGIPRSLFAFVVEGDRIVDIELLSDPSTVARCKVVIF
jgi:hypothetical protein